MGLWIKCYFGAIIKRGNEERAFQKRLQGKGTLSEILQSGRLGLFKRACPPDDRKTCPFGYIHRNRPSNAAPMAGKDSNTPYFKKVRFWKGTPQLRRSPDHMIPAKAPIGVKKAPMFEPITVA